MSTYPHKPFFDQVYEGRAPWDVGAPQPDLMSLIEEFPPQGRILDLGCGTGDLAIGLARAGHTVLGVDFVDAAIEVARSRAGELPDEVRARVAFEVGDALKPSRWAGDSPVAPRANARSRMNFGAVVDSGFYHLFDAGPRSALFDELGRTLPVGGRYYMLGFAIAIPSDEAPRQVTREELEALFSMERGWKVNAIRSAGFRTFGFDSIPSVVMCAERV